MALTIALTGASGAMGSAAVKFLLASERNHKLKLLLRDDAVSRKYARSLKGTDPEPNAPITSAPSISRKRYALRNRNPNSCIFRR